MPDPAPTFVLGSGGITTGGPVPFDVVSFTPRGDEIKASSFASHGAFETPPDNNLPDLFVMSADGTDVRPVTRSKEWDGDPDWGPKR